MEPGNAGPILADGEQPAGPFGNGGIRAGVRAALGFLSGGSDPAAASGQCGQRAVNGGQDEACGQL
ncbi:hypothetical protein D3C75_1109170 [compost metagenome]